MNEGSRWLRAVAVSTLVGLAVLATASPAQAGHGHSRWHLAWSAGWYGPGYGPWFWGPTWGAVAVYDTPYPDYGALDLDVEPETAEIYVDGQLVGDADDYDGFPTYLWLPRGTYDVVIYQPGYQTISRQYSIYQGAVIDVEDRMQPGEAVRPEDLVSRSTERRDDRLRREAERQAAAAEREARREERDDWRSRRSRDRALPPAEVAPEPVPEERGAQAEVGQRLTLRIEPVDASVYLDGNFVGTGADLAATRQGLAVAAGEHVVDVVRPGRAGRQLRFVVESGRDLTLEISLQPLEASED
jgi:hypothetical protein